MPRFTGGINITKKDIGSWYVTRDGRYAKITSITSISPLRQTLGVIGDVLLEDGIYIDNWEYDGKYHRHNKSPHKSDLVRKLDDLEVELLGLEDLRKNGVRYDI